MCMIPHYKLNLGVNLGGHQTTEKLVPDLNNKKYLTIRIVYFKVE